MSYGTLYDTCRRAAYLRDLEFSLTRSQHKELSTQNCTYCGELPAPFNCYIKSEGTMRRASKKIRQSTVDLAWINANGIDRVDSNQGYIISNCVACCSNCNRAKWELSLSEFLMHVQKIVSFQNKKVA